MPTLEQWSERSSREAQGGCLGTKTERKDVISCESFGEEQISRDPGDVWNRKQLRKPPVIHTQIHNVWKEPRTETSSTRRKENSIPKSSGERKGEPKPACVRRRNLQTALKFSELTERFESGKESAKAPYV